MPFVQGHLRSEPIAVTIESACGHCGRALRIEIQHDLRHRVLEGGEPLIFLPIVDFEKIQDPSIIHDF
ncbi:MAG: hypothetical protein ACR2P8_14935 [Myxococcota bacterium]